MIAYLFQHVTVAAFAAKFRSRRIFHGLHNGCEPHSLATLRTPVLKALTHWLSCPNRVVLNSPAGNLFLTRPEEFAESADRATPAACSVSYRHDAERFSPRIGTWRPSSANGTQRRDFATTIV
ncbi:MAG: hypothetical protein JF566_01940 [Bradyrhizobium sp.]|nr:hypothetical protein [Bradyrhizobium sp.]